MKAKILQFLRKFYFVMITKMIKGFILIFFLFIFSIINSFSNLCAPEIGAYNMDLEDLTPEGQINFLYSQGLKGIVFEANESTFNKYFESSLVKTGIFNIYSVYVYYNPVERINCNFYKTIFKQIRNTNTIFQLIVQGKNLPFDQVKDSLHTIATLAKQYNQNITIYPHDHDFIESAEDALKMIHALGRDNVFTAVHLSHELRHGNGNRIAEVVRNVSPNISTISISGASLEELDNFLDSRDVIKPLNMGTYNLAPFYSSLHTYGYKGPIIIHTYGIKDYLNLEPKDHLVNSINFILNLAKVSFDLTQTYNVPGLIEAEFFNNSLEKEIIEVAYDYMGHHCISSGKEWIKVDYTVNVKKTAEYILLIRALPLYAPQEMVFLINDFQFGFFSISSLNNWIDQEQKLLLSEGVHKLSIEFKGGKINWFQLKEPPIKKENIIVLNNPTSTYFKVKLEKDETIDIYSCMGVLKQTITGSGEIKFGENFESGFYFVKYKNQTTKILKQ